MTNSGKSYLLYLIFVPSAIALVTQAALIFAMNLKLRPAQLFGAMVVSAVTGGAVSLLLSEAVHIPPAAAGAIGAMTGALPAVILPFILLRWVAQKLNIDIENFNDVIDSMRVQMQGGEVGAEKPETEADKKSDTEKPITPAETEDSKPDSGGQS